MASISIVSCPKSFKGKDAINQENAIKSWQLGAPGADIILAGDDPGVAEFAREHGLRHIERIARNAKGTPLIQSIINEGMSAAKHPIVAYINADIIVPPDFGAIISRAAANLASEKNFLIYGGRWNTEVDGPIDFSDAQWYEKQLSHAQEVGWLDAKIAMDYFIFPRTIDWAMPPLLLGRFSWDSWFPWRVHQLGGKLIDATHAIGILHPKHDYHYFKEKPFRPFTEEEKMNFKLLGFPHRYTIGDATDVLLPDGTIEKRDRPSGAHLRERLIEMRIWGSYLMRGAWYPYSYPLYLLWKTAGKISSRKQT